jgi:small subunit ribosomal protein S8e
LSSNVTVRQVRCRGGNIKHRALRLDTGNFAWGSENCTRKTRILDVVYNASNNELVRTKTLVKSAIIAIDAAPFRAWYAQHYGKKVGVKVKNGEKVESETIDEKRSKSVTMKLRSRNKDHSVAPAIDEQFSTGRLLAIITSRPGQCGRSDGYILEGKELDFYQKKLQKKKHATKAAAAAAAAVVAAVAE